MEYLGCQGCSNYGSTSFMGHTFMVCWGNVNNPLKCPLRKRVLNPDIKEFVDDLNKRLEGLNANRTR